MTNYPGLTTWLAFGERGISSEAIVHKLAFDREPSSRHCYPYDPDDFRRCELVLRQVFGLRHKLHVMADVSPVWAGLVARWDELVALMEEECPDVWDRYPRGAAPRAYKIMQDIRKAAKA
jgi:hypothetical protein